MKTFYSCGENQGNDIEFFAFLHTIIMNGIGGTQ